MSETVAVLPVIARPLLDDRLPNWINAQWYASQEQALALAPLAEIGWLDMRSKETMAKAIASATRLKWLNSVYAGVERFPLAQLAAQGTILTNGAGINAITIAEYVVMGMLSIAKGYAQVVRAQDRQEWLKSSPGTSELYQSRALIIGFGSIGQEVAKRLEAFGVNVTAVRRNPSPGALPPDGWRARLGEFDWVILAVPATSETDKMIGATELAAMKPGSALINVARGTVVDTPALVDALKSGPLGHAFLDVTDPEPLPPGHSLWTMPNAHISMHLSGNAQTRMMERAALRFLENLERYREGRPLLSQVDLALGY